MISIPRRLFVPKVLDALLIECDILLLYGGRDAGKSTSVAKFIVPQLINSTHFRGIHARSQYNQLRVSTFQNIKDRIGEFGWKGAINTTAHNFSFTNKLYPNNYLIGGSGDAADNLRSAQDINFIWFDEFHDACEEDFTSIYGTMRMTDLWPCKFIATFNTDKITMEHWIYRNFFSEKKLEGVKIVTVKINCTDNPFINHQKTIDKHRTASLGNEDIFQSISNGEWALSDVVGKWIYVDYQHIIKTELIPIIPGNTLYLSFDFNNEPLTCTVWQFSSGKHPMSGEGHFIRAVAEFEASMLESDEEIIHLLCAKIKAAFPYHPKRVTGDANGRHRLKGVPGHKSAYTLICKYLNVSPQLLDVPMSDMHLDVSRRLCNTFLYNHKGVQISAVNTPKLLKDIKTAKADPDKPDQIVKGGRGQGNDNDYFDTFRYIVHTYFNYFLR